MKIHTHPQNSPEWNAARAGVWTASSIGKLLTGKGAIADNETSRGLIARIARERMTGRPESSPASRDMERGHHMEPIARDYYHRLVSPVDQVGFVTAEISGITVGCSPDGLVSDCGLIEIKSRNESVHFAELIDGQVPTENLPQIQFQLLVTGRDWCDYVAFCDGWPLIVRRVVRDFDRQAVLVEAVTRAEAAVGELIKRYQERAVNLHWTDKIPDVSNLEIS